MYIERTEENKTWVIKDDNEILWDIKLTSSLSISNAFDKVSELLNDMFSNVEGFDDWLRNVILRYKEEGLSSILLDECDNFYYFSEKYFNYLQIPIDTFIDKTKISKTSVVFYEEDLKELIILCISLKVYSIFSANSVQEYKVLDNTNTAIYRKLSSKCVELKLQDKIYNIIQSKVYRKYTSDRMLWTILAEFSIETPDNFIMSLFNFILNNLLVTIDINKNPVSFLTGAIDKSVSWLLKSSHGNMIYKNDSISIGDEIHSHDRYRDSFSIYCDNDLISKICRITYDILKVEKGLGDDVIDRITQDIEKMEYIYNYMKLTTLPLFEKSMNIPYDHLLQISPKNIAILGMFMHHVSVETRLIDTYPRILNYLICIPSPGANTASQTFTNMKSSYQMRYPEHFVNNYQNTTFGFKELTIKGKLIAHICGILSNTKKYLIDIYKCQPIKNISHYEFEKEVLAYFTRLYNDSLDLKLFKERINHYI